MNARPTLDQPKRSRASLILLITLALILLALSIFLASSIPQETILPDQTQPLETAALANAGFDCDALEAQKLYPFADGVIKLTPNRLAFLSLDGSEVYSVEIAMASPFAVYSSERFIAADREGTSFVVVDQEGVVYQGQREGRLAGAAFSSDQTLALIEDRHNSTGVVSVLDRLTGQLLFECFFPESGYVLSVQFAPDGQSFDVALMNTDGVTLKPMLKRFSITGEALGQRMIDLEGIFPQIIYDRDQRPIICSHTQLAGVDYNQESFRFQAELARIEAVIGTDAQSVLLASELLSDKLSIYSLSSDGQLVQVQEIGESHTALTARASQVAFGSGTRILICDAKNGQIIEEQNLAADVVRVGFAGENRLTVITATGVRQIALQQA